jgi:hypothetical protein
MNMKKTILLCILSISIFSCSSDDTGGSNGSVSPSDADGLSEILVIPNAEVVNSPDLPPSSDAGVAPVISYIDTNISYSSGSQIIIPSNVASPTASNIAGVYIQVKGASTYFDVPINAATYNGTFTIPVDLPLNVEDGDFILVLKFYDTMGNISAITEIFVKVTSPNNCDETKVSGGEGLTSTIFNLPNKAGLITIAYDTFSVRDKIDVFQNGIWIGGTGQTTVRNTLRRPLSCAAATENLGYVGTNSEFEFTYSPGAGTEIEVVVSGCENGGTAWEYTFSCPETVTIVPNVGTYVIDGVSISGTCYSAAPIDCVSNTAKNITILGSDGAFFSIKNMTAASSGTFPFVIYAPGTCSPYVMASLGSWLGVVSAVSSTTGSYTKTGATSFTFSTTFTDSDDILRTVTGSGSY